MTHALRDLLLPQTTIATPNGHELRLLAEQDDDEDPSIADCAERLVAAGCEFVLVTGTHEATREIVNTLYGKGGVVRTDTWARLPGPFNGAGCTLAVGDRRDARERPRALRRGARGAGLHVERAAQGLPARHGPASCPTACSGRARRATRAATRRRRRAPPTRVAAIDDARRARSRGCAGLYAVTPDMADTRRLVAKCAAAIDGGAQRDPVPQQGARPRALRDAGARDRRAVPRRAARSRSSTTTPRSRATSAPTACTSARTTAASPRRARRVGPARLVGASCYDALARAQRRGRRGRRLRRVRQLLRVAAPSPARGARARPRAARARARRADRRDRRHRRRQRPRAGRGRRRCASR